jgi:hypothetical protein
MKGALPVAVGLVVALCGADCYAVVAFDEGGIDSTGTQSMPTVVTMTLGVNSIKGTLRTTSSTDFQDWFAVTVPVGMQLANLVLGDYQSTDQQGFTGFQTGSSFSGMTSLASSYTGYSHYGTGATNGSLPATNLIGADLLPIMADNSPGGTSAGAQGFTIPLGAGTYTFLIQQTGSAATAYQFDYNVTAVPEPGAGLLCVLGAGCALAATKRRGRGGQGGLVECKDVRPLVKVALR